MNRKSQYLLQFTKEELTLMSRIGFQISAKTVDEIYAKFAAKYPEWAMATDASEDKAILDASFGIVRES